MSSHPYSYLSDYHRERERARAFIIEDGIGVALRRMKGLIEQREGGQHHCEGAHGIMNKQDGGRMRLPSPTSLWKERLDACMLSP